jgi:multidrug efflux pump
MTSFAFILGVVPLVIAEGAGAEMRRTLGTAVFSGMLGVTLFGIFLTPVFFYVIQWFTPTVPSGTPAGAGEHAGSGTQPDWHVSPAPPLDRPAPPETGIQTHPEKPRS